MTSLCARRCLLTEANIFCCQGLLIYVKVVLNNANAGLECRGRHGEAIA